MAKKEKILKNFRLWSIAKRLYNGDAMAGKRREASFQKIEKAAKELIKELNRRGFDWKKVAGYMPLHGERVFENQYLRLTIDREVFDEPYEGVCESPLDRIRIIFDLIAREKDGESPSLFFEVRKPLNWRNPKVILVTAEGTPAQLTRFVSVIINEVANLKPVDFSK